MSKNISASYKLVTRSCAEERDTRFIHNPWMDNIEPKTCAEWDSPTRRKQNRRNPFHDMPRTGSNATHKRGSKPLSNQLNGHPTLVSITYWETRRQRGTTMPRVPGLERPIFMREAWHCCNLSLVTHCTPPHLQHSFGHLGYFQHVCRLLLSLKNIKSDFPFTPRL